MKKITQITSLITLLIVSSCTLYKAKNYLKEGEVVQENFKTVIPFEMKNGLIILKVTIKNKIHDFILDTGATNVVSKELAKELQLNTLDSVKVNDIYNESQALKYAKLDKVTIGDVDFIETVTLISDFKEIPTWSCLGVDGFIGSNLMKNAIWDFDFEKKIITITNDESKLNLPEDVIENKLFIGYGGLPSIMTKMNDRKVWNVTVDFGFNGGWYLWTEE